MCLHGLSRSGQLQWARRSAQAFGNSGTPASANTASSSGGTSPSSSRATKPTLAAIAAKIEAHWSAVGTARATVTRYGFAREPWTCAARIPGETASSTTWPARA